MARDKSTMRRACLVATAAFLVAGCASAHSGANAAPTTRATTASSIATTDPTTTKANFKVQSLGLTFVLSPSFSAAQDESFAFLARSLNPRAVFSIDYDTAAVTDREARAGESLSKTDVSGVHAVLVTHAAIEGLPAGIDATELLVANASRSFSVIMSAAKTDLPALWQTFIESISIESG